MKGGKPARLIIPHCVVAMLPVLVIVVMVPELKIVNRPLIVPELFSSAMMLLLFIAMLLLEIVPELFSSAMVPLLFIAMLLPESVIPAATEKLSRVHPVVCDKSIAVLVFTEYGSGDRHAASAGK